MRKNKLIEFLNKKVDEYDQPSFIKNDPVCIPHMFARQEDVEIAGFFAAIFAWGNRTIIINKSKELMQRMDNAPHQFVLHHSDKDLQRLLGFCHRTFNDTDLLYFISFMHHHYQQEQSLETAFTRWGHSIEEMLIGFHHYFFSLEHVPARTRKHIATPERNSTCKRLNMFLRWMVRQNSTVDFGIWNTINPAGLICPVDLHVARVAKRFGLLHRKQTDWNAALELTAFLRTLDPRDPVKYDYALFGLGVIEKYQ